MDNRIGIFGGSFDPIHYGHLRSAEEIRERFGLEKVVFVPTYIHPLKTAGEGANAEHRLEMAREAIRGNPFFEVSDFEIARGEVSYTVITLEHFGKKYPDSRIFFILGIDGWLEITSWREYQRLFEKADLVVHTRPGFPMKKPEETLPVEPAKKLVYDGDSYRHVSGNRLWFFPVTDIRISATDIRRRLNEGLSVRYMAPEGVLNYIEKHNLYRRM